MATAPATAATTAVVQPPRLPALGLGDERIDKLTCTVHVLLESAIRNCDGFQITKDDVEKIMDWVKTSDEQVEIPFKPARVILQDFTGVPVLVDFASMQDAMSKLGGDPDKINPMVPADLVIDHSVTADVVRSESAVEANMELEFERNKNRFACLKWGSSAFHNMLIIPPVSGTVHQGVKAVTAKTFERSHRSNLVGMGIISLCFKSGEDMESLGLTGHEQYTIHLPTSVSKMRPGQDIVVATNTGKLFTSILRFDTEVEFAYFDHGGILHYVVRKLINSEC